MEPKPCLLVEVYDASNVRRWFGLFKARSVSRQTVLDHCDDTWSKEIVSVAPGDSIVTTEVHWAGVLVGYIIVEKTSVIDV